MRPRRIAVRIGGVLCEGVARSLPSSNCPANHDRAFCAALHCGKAIGRQDLADDMHVAAVIDRIEFGPFDRGSGPRLGMGTIARAIGTRITKVGAWWLNL